MTKRITTGKLDNVQNGVVDKAGIGWESMLAAVENEIEVATRRLRDLKRSVVILQDKIDRQEPFPPACADT